MRNQDASEALGFTWDRRTARPLPAYTPQRATWRFKRMLAEYVWDASQLEGNPFTYPQVQTLLDGVTVGGQKLTDEQQILNLANAAHELVRLVGAGRFRLDKATSNSLHSIIGYKDAFDAGLFRGEGQIMSQTSVFIGAGDPERHYPAPTERGGGNLRRIHEQGAAFITHSLRDPFEQAAAYFLFGALQQFYFDCNKRTARYMMNGWLMSHGVDAISVPARRREEFNTEMGEFYRFKNGTAMFRFLAVCWEDAQ
jgi:Fic family protein